MAHHPNQKRNLASATEPQIQKPVTDLAGKRHPRKSSAAEAAVYSLTNHFSRLHPSSKTTKPQDPPPQKLVDTHMQIKTLSKSANFEPSIQKIGKQGKRVVFESDKKALVVAGERRDKEIVLASAAAVEVKKVERELGEKERGKLVIKPTRTIEKLRLHGKIESRRSFCDAQVELSNFLVTNCAKVVSADMPPFVQIHAVGFARNTKDSLEKFTSKSLALSLKKEFDGAYGPAWHCIVGTSFGSFVTHSVGGFLYFSLDQKVYVLLFKTTVQRAG